MNKFYNRVSVVLKPSIQLVNDFTRKNSTLAIILMYNITLVIGTVLFYFLLPTLLNYPPGFSEIANKYYVSYLSQFILIIMAVLLVGSAFYFIVLRGIDKWKKIGTDGMIKTVEIQAIRRKCLNLPYMIYIAQIIIPILFFLIIFPFVATFNVLSYAFLSKITIVIFSMVSLTSIVSLIFSRKLFTQILLKTETRLELEGIRIKLRNKIFLQIVPMIIASILFTSLVGYSRLIEEKGNLLYKLFKTQLNEIYTQTQGSFSEDQIKQLLQNVKLENVKDCAFIITPKKQIITTDGTTLNKIFTIYLFDYFSKYNGHIYDSTAETQGAAVKLNGIDGEYIVGVKYEVVSSKAVIYFIIGFIMLFIINILILSYFSKSLAGDISLVADNLTEIADNTGSKLDRKIPVTSNDEIGDLVVAFNKIQDLEKQHITEIGKNQQILMERERLATLGQMIGGIAHNLRSPIMSIAGGLEALKDLVKEYDESVDNDNVTGEDHHEIAREMLEWLESIKPYCTFMSDLISAVREQAVQLNASTNSCFTLEELVKRIELLLKYELMKNNCNLETDIRVDLNTQIAGEVNNLVQVCSNLIINAIQAYEGQRGKIEFVVARQDNNRLLFTIKDYGKGMLPEVKNRLLKEMITTKGKRGTGLGLFMSNLTIKGRFSGDLWFESEEGQGSTFYFSIPC